MNITSMRLVPITGYDLTGLMDWLEAEEFKLAPRHAIPLAWKGGPWIQTGCIMIGGVRQDPTTLQRRVGFERLPDRETICIMSQRGCIPFPTEPGTRIYSRHFVLVSKFVPDIPSNQNRSS